MTEPNLLHQYASFNSIFFFFFLTADEIAVPAETYRANGPANVIFRSGGGASNKVTTFYEDAIGGKVEFFIDDLTIDSLVSPNQKSRATTATFIEFTVSEPYSMGLFMQTLQIAAIQSGYTNYIEAPFMLTVEFVGFDDDGDRLVTQEGDNLMRNFPLKLTNIELEVDRGGTTYRVEALPWNEQAFLDSAQSANSDIQLKGATVIELLQTGEQGLTTILNGRLEELRKANQLAEADEVIITFPKDVATVVSPPANTSVPDAGSTKPKSRGSGVGKLLGAAIIGGIAVNEINKRGGLGNLLGGLDKSLGGLLTNFKNGNTQGLFSSISGFLGAQAPQNFEGFLSMVTGQVLTKSSIGQNLAKIAQTPESVNFLGNQKIIEKFTDQGQAPMAQTGLIYDKRNKVTTRAKNVISNNERVFNFKEGTKTTRIIEEVLLSSQWGKNLKDQSPDENGMINWFKIEAETYLKPNVVQENVYGTNAKVYHYKVTPYLVHHSHLQNMQQAGLNYDALKANAVKEYNYIYSGENLDILSFDIRLNGAFRQFIQSDASQGSVDAKTGATQQNAVADKVDQLSLDTEISGTFSATGAASQVFRLATSSQGSGGAGIDNSKIRWARQFHDNILGSGSIDLVEVDIEIFGDPYFIADSGLGNFSVGPGALNINAEGQMEYQRSELDVILNFRTPIDYDPDIGDMIFPEETALVGQFSGLYKVIEVSNRFSGGRFTQMLKLLRRRGQPDDVNTVGVTNQAYKVKNAGPEEQINNPFEGQ